MTERTYISNASNRSVDWLRQSENDMLWAEHSNAGGFFAQTCFIAQQAGEKALKALCFHRGYDVVRTHSLLQIVQALDVRETLEKFAKELDLYYISGRYPDAFPAGAPFEFFTSEQADRALDAARAILAAVKQYIGIG